MVRVDILDENNTLLKGRGAFFKDFNQNTNSEIDILEKVPGIKHRVDIIFSNAIGVWSKQQYDWAQWKTPHKTLNEEFTKKKANESRSAMITRNIPGATRRVRDTILSFTAKGSKKLKKTKKRKNNKAGVGTNKQVGTVVWYDSVDFTRLEKLKAYNSGTFGRFTVIFPETQIELPLTNDATRIISPSDRDTDNPNLESWNNILSANIAELEASGKKVPKKLPTNPKLIIKYYPSSGSIPRRTPYGE